MRAIPLTPSFPNPPAAATATPKRRPAHQRLARVRRYAIFGLLLVMLAGFGWAEPAFWTLGNAMSVLQAVSVVAILGVGVTVTMAVAGFDLSIGAIAASSVMVASYSMVVWQNGALASLLTVLALGVVVGLFNALLIVKLKVPDLLATLAVMFLLGGLQLIPTAGRSISSGLILPDGSSALGAYSPEFLALGRASLWGVVPVPVVILALVALVFHVLTEHTRVGRLLFATGGNEVAARLAGAATARLKVLAYVISASLAALGGALVAARVGRGDVSSGSSLLMDAVAASLIGYAVLDARRPNVMGTVVGAIFVGVLLNGLTMLNAPYYTQDFVKGLVLVGALAMTYGLSRRD
jgi:simple sugar transport system permease protein